MARRQMTEETTEETAAAPKTGALAKWAGGANGVAIPKDKLAMAMAAASSDDHAVGDPNKVFLSFSGKSGKWELGRDKENRGEDWLGIVDPANFNEGWTCWKGSKAVGKKSWLIQDRAELGVGIGALEDHGPYREGEGWKPMLGCGILMFFTDMSPDDAVEAEYETNAVSARGALSDLSKQILAKILADDPAYYPLVELGEEEFEAHGQWNYKPTFTVLQWLTQSQVVSAVADPSFINDLLDEEAAPPPPPPTRRAAARRRA